MAPNDPNVGQLWDTDILSGSQSFPRTFLKVGTFPYFCRIQGTFMSGVISVVDKAPLPASLPAPTLISPPDGSTGEDPTPTFEWSQVADPRDVTYTLEIGFGTADFKNVAFTADGILATQFTLSIGDALAPGDYIWHVRAVDGAGNTDNFSTPSTFTIVAAVPSPINNQHRCRGTRGRFLLQSRHHSCQARPRSYFRCDQHWERASHLLYRPFTAKGLRC